MKNILAITTGGTIASMPSGGGLAPALTSEQLIGSVPELRGICNVSTVQFCNLDSTNMCWREWCSIASLIRDRYNDFDGFVITHGTDTLAYAAAALSYLIQQNRRPIVLTGSQKPVCDRDSDGRRNLLQSFIYASSDRACLTHVVFDGHVICGTRARKTRTKSFNAFSSIDYPDVAAFRDYDLVTYIDETDECRHTVFYDKLCPDIAVIKLIPGMSPSIFDYVANSCRGVIIECFGVGGIPSYGEGAFEAAIEKMLSCNVRIVMTTQVPHEGSDLSVYRVGSTLLERFNLIEASDMTLEAAVSKMMWALTLSDSEEKFRSLFLSPVGKDRI